MAAKRQRVNHWTEQDRDTVDLARLSDRELTRYGSCVEMIHHILRRRIGDAALVARGRMTPAQAGGTVKELCEDSADGSARWRATSLPTPPSAFRMRSISWCRRTRRAAPRSWCASGD